MRDCKNNIKHLYSKEFVLANILECTAGTTGYQGGDTGHGGRTYFALKDLGCTDMRVRVKPDTIFDGDFFEGHASEIEIGFGGDCELSTFCEALEFALKVYEKEINKNESI